MILDVPISYMPLKGIAGVSERASERAQLRLERVLQ